MSVRAGIVVTGTEVLSGRVRDENGPWLAERLLELGVDLAHVTICGDRRGDLEAQLDFLAREELQLIVTSGGLGPTADDLTVEVVAAWAGRELHLDDELEARINAIVAPIMRRFPGVDADAVAAASRKQAMVPDGSRVLEPSGTAPGFVITPRGAGGPTVVVLPGPPRELRATWRQAVDTAEFRSAIAGHADYEQHTLRLFGIPESEIAETLRVAEGEIDGLERLETTTCLRRGELEVVVRHEPDADGAYRALEELIAARHAATLFSSDGSTVDDQVAALLDGRTLAVAESCSGGLLAARLTARAGSSAYFAGGVVSYSNEAKTALLGVPASLIERVGAVSPEAADAMASGALERFDADTSVAITGIAGPDGGSEQKPVGYVCLCVKTREGETLARDIRLPGDRTEIRDRSTTVAMHLLRRLLRERLGAPAGGTGAGAPAGTAGPEAA